MKKQSLILWSYSILLFVGGFIGFIKANSLISLFSSSLFAILLSSCGYLIRKGNITAYKIASALTLLLLVFFSYRFFLTYQFMPAGLMIILSSFTFAYLVLQWKTVSNIDLERLED